MILFLIDLNFLSNNSFFLFFEELKLTISENFIRKNFGWDGECDGYYLSASFNTNGGPDYQYNSTRSAISGKYNNNLTMVKGIRK